MKRSGSRLVPGGDDWCRDRILLWAGLKPGGEGRCGLKPCNGGCPEGCTGLSVCAFFLMLIICGRTCPARRVYTPEIVDECFPRYKGRYGEFVLNHCVIWGRYHLLRDCNCIPLDDFGRAYDELKRKGYIIDRKHDFGGEPGKLVRQTMKGYDTFTNFYECWKAQGGQTEFGIFNMG